jgi:hypothetical protein
MRPPGPLEIGLILVVILIIVAVYFVLRRRRIENESVKGKQKNKMERIEAISFFCDECGAELLEDDRFCSKCEVELEEE